MSRQRVWALKAHEIVRSRKDRELQLNSYKTHCKKGPSLVQRAGAVQALAFLRSRKESTDAGRRYADDLAAIYQRGKDGAWLLARAQEAEFGEYLTLSQDLLGISAWLRRFAQIEFPDEDGHA